jgi:hypothetical protein
MMGGFKVPPQGYFNLYSTLVLKQRDHFGGLCAWAGSQCSNVDGLDGLLDPLRGPVVEVCDFFNHKFAQCQTGMTGVSDKVLQARAAYSHSDRRPGVAEEDLPRSAAGIPGGLKPLGDRQLRRH